MDSESSGDSVKRYKCCDCDCGCDCSPSAGDWLRSVKRKHDESKQESQFSVPGLDCDPVARVEIGNECAALRQAVSRQQEAIQDLYAELEEERNAASSAANEAMSMILRLQREKAELQMEARQFKRFVEERVSHDQQELLVLEDLLYKREQAIQALTCEVQAYKHRLMSLGLTESETEVDQYEFPPYEYPPLRCNVMHAGDSDNDDTDVEKYVFGETPKDRLRSIENRISQMERTPTYSQMDGDFTGKNILEKVVVGQSPRRTKHSRKFSCESTLLGPEFMDSPKLNGSFRKMDYVLQSEDYSNSKKVDNASEDGDDVSDRIYTIDSEFKAGAGVYDNYATTPRDLGAEFEDPYTKKLYMRLQALEADRESMRQAIISMRTDKAQLVLLKEIAQHLSKEMSPQRRMAVRKPSFVGSLSFLTVFKWITSIVFWRKKAHQIKYMFGLPSDSAGLLMLLDKGPHLRSWRYLSRTQVVGD
ncbi:myosin-binding protein 7 [Gastrolobium bilobum]|uniref:myosin-binding protein 7 n=1 Tax=Gastrolobium bilobum TaxID=150636 RepID=UPI002AB208E7|nr:myosin-binding protein 7 [Gastrolobium bilobum]